MIDYPSIIGGIKLYEFFRTKGYTYCYEETSGLVALKPPGAFEIGYIPVSIYYSHPYSAKSAEYILNRENYTWEEFCDWLEHKDI